MFLHERDQFGKMFLVVILCIQFIPEALLCRERVQSVDQRPQIKPAAPGDDRQSAARTDACDGVFGISAKTEDVIFFRNIKDVNKMMRHRTLFLGGGLGYPDLQPAIKLHGVSGNDLTVAKGGNFQSESRFSGCCGAHDDGYAAAIIPHKIMQTSFRHFSFPVRDG